MKQVRVCWLAGSARDRKLALESLKGQLPGCEVMVFAGEYSFAYLETQILTNSCFSDSRMFVIRDMPLPSTTKQTMITHFKKLLDNVPADTLVVFNGVDPDAEKALSSHVEKIGRLVRYDSVIAKEQAAEWVVTKFAEYGKTCVSEDAQTLVTMNGFDSEVKGIGADVLRLMIEKISVYVGRRRNVTLEDVMVNSFPSEEFVIWNIFEAMDSKDLTRCMNELQRFIEASDTPEGGIIQLLNIALPRYKLLFFLKEGAAKVSKAEAGKEAAALVKLSPEGVLYNIRMKPDIDEKKGQPKFAYTEFAIQQALFGAWGRKPTIDLYTRKELLRILQCLQEAAVELRARTTLAAKMMLADVLMLTVCGAIDDTHSQRIRNSA